MSVHEYDETWPFLDDFTSGRAKLQQEMLAGLPLFQTIGLALDKLAKDYSKVSIAPRPDLAQPRGFLHGGILATLVDAAAAHSVLTTLKPDHDVVTVHLDTKYFRPVRDERIFAEAAVVRKGRNLAHADVSVVNARGDLIAKGWCVLKLSRRASCAGMRAVA
jgi:acyl-CoA thioesterase